MARLTISELIRILQEHPRYMEFEGGVDARHALSVVFGPGDPMARGADVLEAVDGKEVIINKNRADRVTSIEIQ
jgi:hypothetical protein